MLEQLATARASVHERLVAVREQVEALQEEPREIDIAEKVITPLRATQPEEEQTCPRVTRMRALGETAYR
ncbi:hypothetical protein GCM10009560_52390 [Nonomuraea longicatena]|uniref:Uncharacterized protein n=1 Tax=Nonomuraea longicatena TaxID=83682 RepID=A0ABN1QDD3_9ACTN